MWNSCNSHTRFPLVTAFLNCNEPSRVHAYNLIMHMHGIFAASGECQDRKSVTSVQSVFIVIQKLSGKVLQYDFFFLPETPKVASVESKCDI